jgi:ribonuclease HI
MIVNAYVDGAAHPSRGRASIGVVIEDVSSKVLIGKELSIRSSDNNHAEYAALLFVLGRALQLGHRHLKVHSDSEVMVKQIQGEYRCKGKFSKMHQVCLFLIESFEHFELVHIGRKENREAHLLAQHALRP